MFFLDHAAWLDRQGGIAIAFVFSVTGLQSAVALDYLATAYNYFI
jgi:hypothetical protein